MTSSQRCLPEGRAGQLLAAAIPVLLAAIAAFGILAPALRWYQAREDEIAFKRQEAAHIAGMRQLIPALRRQVAALRAETGDSRIFLAGGTDAIAGADLQSVIQTLAARSGASLESSTMLPGMAVGGLHRITVEVDLTARWPALIALLRAIDLAHPRMIAGNLSLSDSGQMADVRQDIPLQIGFSVTAFRAGE